MKDRLLKILCISLIIRFFLRIQSFLIGIVFLENDSFRTHTVYVRQSLEGNLTSLLYIPIIVSPIIALYKILTSEQFRNSERMNNVIKWMLLVLLIVVVDVFFYAGGGFSFIRTATNSIVKMK